MGGIRYLPKHYYRLADAARILGIGEKRAKKLVIDGVLKGGLRNSVWAVDKTAVRQYIKDRNAAAEVAAERQGELAIAAAPVVQEEAAPILAIVTAEPQQDESALLAALTQIEAGFAALRREITVR